MRDVRQGAVRQSDDVVVLVSALMTALDNDILPAERMQRIVDPLFLLIVSTM